MFQQAVTTFARTRKASGRISISVIRAHRTWGYILVALTASSNGGLLLRLTTRAAPARAAKRPCDNNCLPRFLESTLQVLA